MKQTILTLTLTTTIVNSKLNKRFSQVDNAPLSLTKVDFLNKGGETIIIGTSSNLKLDVYYQALLGPTQAQTIYKFDSYSIPPPTSPSAVIWPDATVLSPGDGQLNYLFSTAYYNTNNGKVRVHEGSHKLWSQQQVLTPPSYVDAANNYFGSALAFDENYDTLFVGCGNCSTRIGKRNGAVYTYKQGSNKAWSQSQEITFTSIYQLGWERIKADGDLLLTDYQNIPDDSTGTKIVSTLLLRKDSDGKYKPEQLLRARNNKDVTSFDVEDDIIVLGSETQSYNAVANAGAVFILGPTTLSSSRSDKSSTIQWSVQQVLYAPTPGIGDNFGFGVSIDKDTLSVIDGDNDINYVFERDASVGKWSLQQSLATTDLPVETLIKDGQILTADDSSLVLFDEFQTSNCLNIFLEDQFGDGWDAAKLIVYKPDGSKDYLANRCDTENPYGLRYCPRNLEDSGFYNFTIADGDSKAKNYWEILWRVYNEDTGKWTVANWDTKLNFFWDADNARFIRKKAEKTLPTNITCSRCPIKPTEKPTNVLRNRHLKGDDNKNTNNGGTVHPTLTPAPTLQTTDGLGINWQKLILKRSAVTKDYFKNDYRGASYYVSDAKSRQLIETGSICNWETTPATCWVDLPDGEYNVRLGGALNEDKAELTWTYCKAKNDLKAQTQLNVKIEDGACTILGSHTALRFCGAYDSTNNIELEFVVMGVESTDPLNSYDISALSQAVAYTFNGVSTDDVRIESATPTGDGGVVVKAVVIFRQSTSGYDTLSIEGTTTLLSDVQTKMFSDGPKTICSGLQTAEKASVFHSATSVQYISSSISESEDIPLITSSVDEVVSFADETTISTKESPSSTTSPLSTDKILSYVGYGVAGVVAALIVGFFVSGRKTVESETNAPVAVLQREKSSKNRVELKDLNLNPPSLSDLKQLVKDEDDVLRLLTKF